MLHQCRSSTDSSDGWEKKTICHCVTASSLKLLYCIMKAALKAFPFLIRCYQRTQATSTMAAGKLMVSNRSLGSTKWISVWAWPHCHMEDVDGKGYMDNRNNYLHSSYRSQSGSSKTALLGRKSAPANMPWHRPFSQLRSRSGWDPQKTKDMQRIR